MAERYAGISIYAAGKITKNGWRHRLFPITDYYDYSAGDNGGAPPWPAALPIQSLPGATYVGPHFLADDHGCFHGKNTHGVAAGGSSLCVGNPGITRPDVVKSCLTAIEDATHVFAWIDEPTAYGTLVELGYASAQGKHIHLYIAQDCAQADDLWFAGQLAATARAVDAKAAWDDFTQQLARSNVVPFPQG